MFGWGTDANQVFDLIQFEHLFEHCYTKPARDTSLERYRMVVGIVLPLSIGFNRIGHFDSIRDNTIRIARLKLVCIAAKPPFHNNRTTIK